MSFAASTYVVYISYTAYQRKNKYKDLEGSARWMTKKELKNNIENIKIIMKYSSLDELPQQLQEVAEIRLAHPDWSYIRISEVLGIRPEYVGVRFKRIAKIAEKLLKELENKNEI